MAARQLVKIAAIALGVAIIAWGVFERQSLERFKAQGEVATVKSIDGYETRSSRGGGKSHSALFTFVAKDGKQMSGRRYFTETLLKDIEAKGAVEVVYDPRSPQDFVLQKGKTPWGPIFLGATVLIIALFL